MVGLRGGGGEEIRGNGVSPKERIFFDTEKQRARRLSRTYLKSFLPFEGDFNDCNEEKYQGNRKKKFCCMLYILSAKSQSARGASHQPVFMGSCMTISHMCLPCLSSRRISPCVLCPLLVGLMVVLLTFCFA